MNAMSKLLDHAHTTLVQAVIDGSRVPLCYSLWLFYGGLRLMGVPEEEQSKLSDDGNDWFHRVFLGSNTFLLYMGGDRVNTLPNKYITVIKP